MLILRFDKVYCRQDIDILISKNFKKAKYEKIIKEFDALTILEIYIFIFLSRILPLLKWWDESTIFLLRNNNM
jgi:hypothetical protein